MIDGCVEIQPPRRHQRTDKGLWLGFRRWRVQAATLDLACGFRSRLPQSGSPHPHCPLLTLERIDGPIPDPAEAGVWLFDATYVLPPDRDRRCEIWAARQMKGE